MHVSGLLSATLAVGVSAQATSPTTLATASPVNGNPTGVQYKAALPSTSFDGAAYPHGGNIVGSISAQAGPGGRGVKLSVQFSNLPATGGPFLYHIHEKPVVDGNCTATGAHLDPFGRGETPPCNGTASTCQVGDLSGKYGKITSDPFTASYVDPYLSLKQGNPAFFGDLSFVVHYANKTRITCANFGLVNTYSNTTSTCTEGHSPTMTPTGKTAPYGYSYSGGPTAPAYSASSVIVTASSSAVEATSGIVAPSPSKSHVATAAANSNGVAAGALGAGALLAVMVAL